MSRDELAFKILLAIYANDVLTKTIMAPVMASSPGRTFTDGQMHKALATFAWAQADEFIRAGAPHEPSATSPLGAAFAELVATSEEIIDRLKDGLMKNDGPVQRLRNAVKRLDAELFDETR